MSSEKAKELLTQEYERYAQEFARGLLPEDFAETTAQAKQREITLESLALVSAYRDDIHVFNEPLVQYPQQVVPDNMVVVCQEQPKARTSFDVPEEAAGPFWVLDYVSTQKKRKDHEDNFDKYEHDLKVPYCLVFDADARQFTLYRHNGKKYVSVKANKLGRCPVPELEIEVAILDGWVRYWYKGELLPLPADMQRELTRQKRRADEEKVRADEEKARADKLQQRLAEEEAARRALEERLARLEQRNKKDRH